LYVVRGGDHSLHRAVGTGKRSPGGAATEPGAADEPGATDEFGDVLEEVARFIKDVAEQRAG
jgi:hypothetical protein